MSTFSEADRRMLKEAFYDALESYHGRGGRGGGGSFSATPGGSIGGGSRSNLFEAIGKDFGSTLTSAGKASLELGGKLLKGGANVGEAADILASNFKMAGYEGGVLTKALGGAATVTKELINYIQEGMGAFQSLTDSGASFNNSIVEMRAAGVGMGMSINEMAGFFRDNGKKIAQLGSGAADAAKNFAVLSKGLIQSPAGDKLAQIGYRADELNEILAVSTMNMTQRELKEAGGTDRAIKAAVDLATEMDAMAKLTGRSRKEQLKALEEQKADGRSQAAVQREILKGNVNAGKAFDAAIAQAGVAGKGFQNVMRDFITTGRPQTEENRKYYAIMSAETKSAIDEARAAYKRGDVKAAEDAAKRAAALEAIDVATNQSRLELAEQGMAVQKMSTEEQLKYGNILREKAKEMGRSELDPAAITAAREELAKKMKEEQDKRDGSTAAVIEMNNRLRSAALALQDNLVKPLNEKVNEPLNKFATALGEVNKNFNMLPVGAKDKDGKSIQGQLTGGAAFELGKPLTAVVQNLTRGGEMERPPVEFKDPKLQQVRESAIDVIKQKAGTLSSKAEEDRLLDLGRALNKTSVNAELVSKALKDIADKNNKSVEDLLKESTSTQGGMKQLIDQLSKDSKVDRALKEAASAREATTKSRTGVAQDIAAGQTVTGTSFDRAGEALKEGLKGVKNITTGAIDYMSVNGDVNAVDRAREGPAPEPRSTGTIGETGGLHEKKGAILQITGDRETVFTDKQLSNLAKGIHTTSLDSSLNMMTSLFKNADDDSNNVDNLKIFDTIKSTISAATSNLPKQSQPIQVGNLKVSEFIKDIDSLNVKTLKTDKLSDTAAKNANVNFDKNAEDSNKLKDITSQAINSSKDFQAMLKDMLTIGKPQTEETRKYYAMMSTEAKKAIDEAKAAYQKGDVKATNDAIQKAINDKETQRTLATIELTKSLDNKKIDLENKRILANDAAAKEADSKKLDLETQRSLLALKAAGVIDEKGFDLRSKRILETESIAKELDNKAKELDSKKLDLETQRSLLALKAAGAIDEKEFDLRSKRILETNAAAQKTDAELFKVTSGFIDKLKSVTGKVPEIKVDTAEQPFIENLKNTAKIIGEINLKLSNAGNIKVKSAEFETKEKPKDVQTNENADKIKDSLISQFGELTKTLESFPKEIYSNFESINFRKVFDKIQEETKNKSVEKIDSTEIKETVNGLTSKISKNLSFDSDQNLDKIKDQISKSFTIDIPKEESTTNTSILKNIESSLTTQKATDSLGEIKKEAVVDGISNVSQDLKVESSLPKIDRYEELTKSFDIRSITTQMVNDLKPKANENQTTKEKEPQKVEGAEKYVSSQKSSTLDDVVKRLDMLNITMNQLLSQSETLGRKQIRATKASADNVYEKYMP